MTSTHAEGPANRPDVLGAVPFVTPDTRSEPLSGRAGLLLVRREPTSSGWPAWFRGRLGWLRERAFELDAVGALFFDQIDGQRSLAEIQNALTRELGLDAGAARAAVIAFTAELMTRGLVALRVERDGT